MKVAIIVGNTASGKSTVLDKLCEEHNFEKLITTTTRDPRPGEMNGVDYHFIDRETFKEKIEQGFFLEHVEAKGNFYGAGLNAFEKDFGNKKPAVILDPEGAKNASDILKKQGHTPVVVFINETPDTCVERVLNREASAAEKVKRVKDIREVEANWSSYMKYDHKTKPLSSVNDNCLDIKSFVENFPEYTFEKIENKSNRKLKL